MDMEKTREPGRRVATVVLSPGFFGRPMVGSRGIPPDRVKILRESFMKTRSDPELLAEAEKRGSEPKHVNGEKLEALAREVVTQPPEVITRMNVVLGR
jgi:tripartite-type tricarboxylate transporter receptor subunit TctC